MTMSIKGKSRRGLALLLTVVMVLAIAPLAANASGVTSLTVGQTQSGYQVTNANGSGYGTITNVVSSNTAFVTVATWNASGFSLTGVAAGSAVVTITYTDTNTGTTGLTDTLSVTVSASSSNTATSGTVSVVAGSTSTVGSFYQIHSVTMANTAIATPVFSTVAGSGTLTLTGLTAGSTTMTVYATLTNGATPTYYTYTVNVTASSTTNTTNTTSGYTQNHSLDAGKTASIEFVSATNIVSSNSAVATATFANGKLTMTGVSAGTATITFTGTTSSSSTAMTYTINLTVTGTASGSSTSSGSTSGLVFSKTSTSIAANKSYRLKNIKLDGVSVAAAELRWMSSDTDVLTVNATSGIFKGKSSGTAYLVAIDPSNGGVAVLKVTVS